MVTPLAEYFKKYGWEFHEQPDGTFMSGFQGDNSVFGVVISLDGQWLSFVLNTLLSVRDTQQLDRIQRKLLNLNNKIPMCRFALDENSYVVLRVDYPTQFECSYALFELILNLLSNVADDEYPGLVEALADPKI